MCLVIKTKTPAKLNCFLRITGRLPNGYHTIYTLFRKITLWDYLTIILEQGDFPPRIEVDVFNDPSVPGGEKNLAHKAARFFFHETGMGAKVKIVIEKFVPSGAGLGGGSSDAACVLSCLNQVFGKPIASKDLFRLAKMLGADCPFFIHSAHACVAKGIGHELFPVRLRKYYFLLILPDIHVSTRWAYNHFVLTKTKDEISLVPEKLDAFEHWTNDFEPVVFARFPELETYKRELMRNGAGIALMTGSGSTIFGLFDSRKEAERARSSMMASVKGRAPQIVLAESL